MDMLESVTSQNNVSEICQGGQRQRVLLARAL